MTMQNKLIDLGTHIAYGQMMYLTQKADPDDPFIFHFVQQDFYRWQQRYAPRWKNPSWTFVKAPDLNSQSVGWSTEVPKRFVRKTPVQYDYFDENGKGVKE